MRRAGTTAGLAIATVAATGHAIWQGRDPGGAAPDAGDTTELAAQPANR